VKSEAEAKTLQFEGVRLKGIGLIPLVHSALSVLYEIQSMSSNLLEPIVFNKEDPHDVAKLVS
jgi:hypothetical protein